MPRFVRHQAIRCLLDTIGAAVAGRQTDCSRIIYDFAVATFGGHGASLWLDGRSVSSAGAALAHGMTVDSIDIHDGYNLAKGHIGASVIPAVLATLSMEKSVPGQELLASLVVGYEIAGRAGRALHATVADYHTSGAWNALGAAAVTARRLRLTKNQTREALGIAEYHGPRSQMMRCIDYPSMVKDGSGWGALAGVSAAIMAQAGFSGAPAVTVEGADVASYWADLGENWLIMDQYFKPYAVCRWAQPAIAGILLLRERYQLAIDAIKAISIYTFHEAVRLAGRHPQNTEEAQYSVCYSVAAALVHGRLGIPELSGEALQDPLVLRLSDSIELIEHDGYNAHFPVNRYARIEVEMEEGSVYDSGPVESIWGSDNPPTDQELKAKFRWLTAGLRPESRITELEEAIWGCAELANGDEINRLLIDG
jgi:2-methylcitrate dehydratase PrpD